MPPIYPPEVAARAIVDAAEQTPRQKILGTWNWLIVALARLLPGVGDHFMARSGVEGQLTDRPIDPDRPDDLFAPVDDDEDHGAEGIFGDRANGVRTPAFLRSLPRTAVTFVGAVWARWREIARGRFG